MNGNGPISPEEAARQQAYWASPALSSPAAAPPPAAPSPADYYGPPAPPPVDSGPMYNYAGGPPAPEPPPAGPKPFSWNAPGFENTHTAPFSGGPAPAAPPAPPSPPSPEQRAAIAAFGAPVGDVEKPKKKVDVSGVAPTAADDREFEAFKKGMAPAARPTTSGGAPNPDYWGTKGAQTALLGTYDAQAASMGREGEAERAKAEMLAARHAELAQLRQEDAAISQEADRAANARFEQHMSETQQQLDDVKAQKIDPGRYMKHQDGFLTVIGGALGGLYMGLNHLDHNPFLDDLNKHIEQDIDAQKADLANQRDAVGQRLSMLGQMRSIYKDHALAELQSKNLYYEAAKDQIAAEGARYDTPIAKERTEQAITSVQRAQDQLKLQIQEAAKHEAMAQAAAAAAQARAARKEAFENTTKLIELGQKDRALDIENEKAGGESKLPQRFVATGKDAHGDPVGYVARDEVDAGKDVAARKSREELRAEINNALAIREGEGTLGRTINRNDPNQAIQLYTPEWQVKVRQSAAALTAAKNKAAGLGALDKGTEALLDREIGNLESRGGESDIRLRGLLSQLDRADEADTKAGAGARVTKKIGPDGRERIIPEGTSNAPDNRRKEPRESLSDERTKKDVKDPAEYYGPRKGAK